jgi:hypothetical protein
MKFFLVLAVVLSITTIGLEATAKVGNIQQNS